VAKALDKRMSEKKLNRAVYLRQWDKDKDMFILPDEPAELAGKKLTLTGLIADCFR
jgi:hypothetical protein